MDMNVALNELREAIDELQCLDLSDEESSASSIEAVLEQFRNFDKLLSSGGPLPDDWDPKKKAASTKPLVGSEAEQILQLLEESRQAGASKFQVNITLPDLDVIRKFESLGAVVTLDPPSNFCTIKWERKD